MLDSYLKIKSDLTKSLTILEDAASSGRVKGAAQLFRLLLLKIIYENI